MYESICLYGNNHQPIDAEIMSYYKCIAGNYTIETIKQMLFTTCLHLREEYSIETQEDVHTNKKRLYLYTNLQVTNRPYETLKVNVKFKTRQIIPQEVLSSILEQWIEYSYETPLWRTNSSLWGKLEENRLVFSKDED